MKGGFLVLGGVIGGIVGMSMAAVFFVAGFISGVTANSQKQVRDSEKKAKVEEFKKGWT